MNAIWHDVECAAYAADLDVWRGLAAETGGPVLDLGCGTGRVAIDLAAHRFEVTGIDTDPELTEALAARARERELGIEAVAADARSFALGRTFALVISPMQVVQLLGGAGGRAAMLESVRGHLDRGGVFAAALANPFEDWSDEESLPPLPDVREKDGWVYSSTPVAVRRTGESFVIERERQAVSPHGEMSEETSAIELDSVTAGMLEAEAEAAGFRARERRQVPETPEYVGSEVVVLEAV